MSISKTGTWAANPSTTRAMGLHLSYDPKSDRIAYTSGKSVFLRSVSSPEKVVQYTQHTAATTVARFSPSGFYVASGDESGKVRVWDCAGDDMVLKGEYPVIGGRINDIAWDVDSQRIIAVGDGKERYGHCFTYDSGNTVGEISGHSSQINAVAIRPCRPYRAVTVSDDSAMVFLQGPPFKFASSVRGHHTNFVRDVAYSKDGEFIVSVGSDRQIVVYEGKTGEFVKKIDSNPHEGGIFGVSWVVEKPGVFVTCSADSSVRMWDVQSGECLKVWSIEKKIDNHFLGIVSTKEYIVAVTYSGDLYYFNETSDEPVKIVYGHNKSVTALSYTKESGLYSGSYDGRVLNWDLETGSAALVQGEAHTNLVVGLAPLANGSVSSTAWDDTLKTVTGTSIKSYASWDKQPVGIASYGQLTAVLFEDQVILYDNEVQAKELKLNFSGAAIDISKEVIAIANGSNNSVAIYTHDLSLVPQSSSLTPLRAKPTALKISPNGEFLAAGESTGKIFCYQLSDYSLKTSRWSFHTSKINSIAWNEDNDHIVSSSLDTNLIVYSVAKAAKNIKFLNAHKEGASGAVWLDANTIISSGADSCLSTWKVEFN